MCLAWLAKIYARGNSPQEALSMQRLAGYARDENAGARIMVLPPNKNAHMLVL